MLRSVRFANKRVTITGTGLFFVLLLLLIHTLSIHKLCSITIGTSTYFCYIYVMDTYKTNKFAVRLPVRVTIYDRETNKVIYHTHSTLKSKIRLSLAAFDAQNAHLRGTWVGCVRVTYHRERGLHNEIFFTNYSRLEYFLRLLTEKELLLDFAKTGDVEPGFLTKKKPSAKQLAALKKNAAKSSLFKKLKNV